MSFMPFLKTKKAMKSLYFFIKLPYALLIKKTEIPSRRAFARLLLETVYLESGLSLLWNPWTFGDNVFTLFVVTHASIVTSDRLLYFTAKN
jgi:hypothetical protein